MDLYWLPDAKDWADAFKAVNTEGDPDVWPRLVQLAGNRLDVVRTERLARAVARFYPTTPPAGLAAAPIRLALLGSSTVEHLVSGIKVAGLRRNLWVDVYTGAYGQYLQDLADPRSSLHAFRPTTILFALDARHLIGPASGVADVASADAALEQILDRLGQSWAQAQALGAEVLQQSVLPVAPGLLGGNEHRLPWSPRRLIAELNDKLRRRADTAGVDLLSLSESVEHGGVGTWYDPAFWFRGKQEIRPQAAPLYGDLVGRLLAARRGRSAKCLVLDLDNTVWGGVIGDDGLGGIVLGQGSALGEAHLALQAYARDLSRRGVILAVCSKNDEAVAMEAFDRHPEMLLRRSDIACFVANWQDKATNIRSIAKQLNIGLDSLVFVDDNPFERNLVRRELPMVMVPEMPEDPASYVNCVADAGYFDATTVTAEDLQRATQYQANLKRQQSEAAVTDLDSYLQNLAMEMPWRDFDAVGLPRIVQLINKSNQFNLTTRRYTQSDAAALIGDDRVITLQLRLTDSFGDNGMIAVIICRPNGEARALEIDTWLMSCRVLGRGVEQASMNLIAEQAGQKGASVLYGRYLPTAKNGMVRDHYRKLGFEQVREEADGASLWRLDLDRYDPGKVFINVTREAA